MNRIKVALDLYDRHLPLFLGRVETPPGLELEFLEVGMVPPRRHGVARHKRMLTDREFDIAEVSLASYILAKARGADDLTAVPVFPRRLFSSNHIFVREDSPISEPAHLRGREVAIWAFQVTMSVLAKGDMQRDHGLSWRDVRWRTQHPEELPLDFAASVDVAPLPAEADMANLLRRGEVDAFINPHPPEEIMTPGRGFRRLFPDPLAENRRYFDAHGYFPIMHLLAVKTALLDRHPTLGTDLVQLFDKAAVMARDYYVDPGFSTIMHARNLLETEMREFDAEVWPTGLSPNRNNLLDFISYCLDQRLIEEPIAPEALFHPSVL